MRVRIEEEQFTLPVGKGYNDWVWLAHYASRVYSKNIYPQGLYLPAFLYLETKSNQFNPHPRQRMRFYLEANGLSQEDITAVVKIRKANHIFTDYEKKWEAQAFGQDRFLTEIKYSYKVSNINRKKDFLFKVRVKNHMSEEIKGLVDLRKHPNDVEVVLTQRQLSSTSSVFEGEVKIPYGNPNHSLYYFERDGDFEDYSQHQLQREQRRGDDFKVSSQPAFVPKEKVMALVEQEMKVSESINQSLQEKQLQAKKRNANSSLCCFTFQQLWAAIEKHYGDELFLRDYEQSSKQRIRVCLQSSMDRLYEIFFYYFIIENQQRDKKEELSTTYQQVLHFLRAYQVFPESKDLLAFLEFYNADHKFARMEDTLDVVNCGIRFPQFVAILLRSVQFLQTSTFLLKGETFDSAVGRVLDRVSEVEEEEEDFTEWRRNLRQSSQVIAFVRGQCEAIKAIFCKQARSSIQNSASEYCLKKEELKRLLQRANITQRSTDLVIEQCFTDLKLREEGLYFYEFLEALQWIALATITSSNEQEQNEEQEAQILVNKFKYLVDHLSSLP